LSHVSHELRSPLSSIYSFTSIVADGLAGDITPEQLGYLQIVLKNSDQLKSMIEDLLTVTREKEGKLSIDLEELSVSDAVNDAVNTVSPNALNRLIALSTDEGGDIPLALADPIRLRQILIILLDNAIKFTPPGGRVNIRVSEARSGFLLIQVTDTGRGIPADMTDKIFEHMVQLDDRPGIDGRKGLGIGLHIAKDLVLRQGGEIWVKSSPGRGSVFSFTVPTPGSNATLQSACQDGALQA
jgi:signal transduction histidine kinase